MKYEIVERKETKVQGLMVKTTNKDNKSMYDIGMLWQKFFEQGVYANIANKVTQSTIGLYTEYEGDYTKPYAFLTCCEVENPKELEGTVIKTIPEGKYAKFIVLGDMKTAVGEFWQELWKMNLDRKYTCDFEEYFMTQDPNIQEIHIYIALK